MSVTQREAETKEEFAEHDQTLAEFFRQFIQRHAIKGQEGDVIVLDVTAEECETLGRSFLGLMVGWAGGLRPSRARRGILPVTIRDDLDLFDEGKEGPIH